MPWEKLAFGTTLGLSLLAGLGALWARDVRRNARMTQVFVAAGVAFTVATVAIGWYLL